ncbi:hypothetical protein J6590_065094, partial [Homalodisca vitripennis]
MDDLINKDHQRDVLNESNSSSSAQAESLFLIHSKPHLLKFRMIDDIRDEYWSPGVPIRLSAINEGDDGNVVSLQEIFSKFTLTGADMVYSHSVLQIIREETIKLENHNMDIGVKVNSISFLVLTIFVPLEDDVKMCGPLKRDEQGTVKTALGNWGHMTRVSRTMSRCAGPKHTKQNTTKPQHKPQNTKTHTNQTNNTNPKTHKTTQTKPKTQPQTQNTHNQPHKPAKTGRARNCYTAEQDDVKMCGPLKRDEQGTVKTALGNWGHMTRELLHSVRELGSYDASEQDDVKMCGPLKRDEQGTVKTSLGNCKPKTARRGTALRLNNLDQCHALDLVGDATDKQPTE